MSNIKKMFLKRKKVITITILVFLASIIFRDLYIKEQEDKEEDYVENILPKAPENLNAKAINTIIKNVDKKQRFKFIVLGDSQGQSKKFKKVLKEALTHKPDFIIHAGDMTTGGKYQQYVEFTNELKKSSVPIICIIGNHDNNHRGEQIFAHIFGPHNFYFSINDYMFVFLNNNENNTVQDFLNLENFTNNFNSYGF